MGKVIGSIIAILLFAIVAVTFIIIRSSKSTYVKYQEYKKYYAERNDDVICLQIIKLAEKVHYYKKNYTHKVKFKSLIDDSIYDLYVEEYDAINLIINDEYKILHESLVLFEIKKNYI